MLSVSLEEFVSYQILIDSMFTIGGLTITNYVKMALEDLSSNVCCIRRKVLYGTGVRILEVGFLE